MPAREERDRSIETLRGIAIILVVTGHAIGDTALSGMRVDEDSLYRYFYDSLKCLRLPLFTAISGFVYCLRPIGRDGAPWIFVRGKIRRILIPMATVGTFEYLLRCYVPAVNTRREIGDIWTIYVYAFDHFWFLQAIFLVFLTT